MRKAIVSALFAGLLLGACAGPDQAGTKQTVGAITGAAVLLP